MLVQFHDNGIPVSMIDLWETDTCCARVCHNAVWGEEAMYRALTTTEAIPVAT